MFILSYNNQWMIIDYKRFVPYETINDGLFIVIEQVPGYTVIKDMSYVLRDTGYWSSYNLP